MAAYLITHSLLSSWLHLIRENPYEDLTTEGDPLAEFMLVLKREPTPRTEAMGMVWMLRWKSCAAALLMPCNPRIWKLLISMAARMLWKWTKSSVSSS